MSRARRSAIREGIEGLSRTGRTRRPPTGGRGGLLDLLLVLGLVCAVGSRTPVGALGWYALERLRGHDTALPTLTAFFDQGASAPSPLHDPDLLPELPPELDVEPVPPGVAPTPKRLPEPWRTAARAALADPPEAVLERLDPDPERSDADRALAWLGRAWAEHADVEAALEELAIGADLRERAVARARAAGASEPWRYAQHRRYLPGSAVHDADRVVSATLGLATVLDMAWPIQAPHRLTSPWGDRDHPVLGTRRFHNGVDLAVPVGTPVYAAQAGTVLSTAEDDRSGRYVVVDHGNGVRTSYCHLDEALVRRGDRVARGESIARSGNTGRSTGPHLHYVVRIGGRTVDPERFRPSDT